MKELKYQTKQTDDLSNTIYEIITEENLINKEYFELFYQVYKKIDYLFDFNYNVIISTSINEPKRI